MGHKVNVSPSQRHLPFSQALYLLLKHYQMNVFPLNEKFPFTIRGPIMQHLSASIISSLFFFMRLLIVEVVTQFIVEDSSSKLQINQPTTLTISFLSSNTKYIYSPYPSGAGGWLYPPSMWAGIPPLWLKRTLTVLFRQGAENSPAIPPVADSWYFEICLRLLFFANLYDVSWIRIKYFYCLLFYCYLSPNTVICWPLLQF